MEYILVYGYDKQSLEKISIDGTSDSTKKVINVSNEYSLRHFSKGVRVKLDGEGVIESGKYVIKTMDITYKQDVYYKDGYTLNDVDVEAKFSVSQSHIDDYISQKLLFITKNKGLLRDVSV